LQIKIEQKKHESSLPSTLNLSVGVKTKDKSNLDSAASMARKSTISMGKFNKALQNEKPEKERKKFTPLVTKEEKTNNLKLLEKVLGSDVSFNTNKAANKVMRGVAPPSTTVPKMKK